MNNFKIKKDGLGNIIISEDSFEMLLACLDNQKFIHELPQNGDSLAVGEEHYKNSQQAMQKIIDDYNKQCRKFLHQKYIMELHADGYFLSKRYEHQDKITPWLEDDMYIVFKLFENTRIQRQIPSTQELLPLSDDDCVMVGTNPIGKTNDGWIVCEPKDTPWLIERLLRLSLIHI